MSQTNKNLDPYNRGGMWAFVFSMVFSTIFFIWISFFHEGVNLNEIPQEVKAEMQASGDTAVETDSADATPTSNEPAWISNDASIAKGEAAYKASCAVCHGDTGKGDGPAGKAIGARDLVEGKWKTGGDSISLFKAITNGLDGTAMAAFPSIDLADRWAIVHYVRSITNNKGKDDAKALENFATSAK